MKNDRTQGSEEKSGTRYILLTRHESKATSEPDNNDLGSMKNFARTFIPMKEIEELLSGE